MVLVSVNAICVAQHLCAGLKKNSTLTELNVSWNRFGPEGAKHLGPSLQAFSLSEAHSFA